MTGLADVQAVLDSDQVIMVSEDDDGIPLWIAFLMVHAGFLFCFVWLVSNYSPKDFLSLRFFEEQPGQESPPYWALFVTFFFPGLVLVGIFHEAPKHLEKAVLAPFWLFVGLFVIYVIFNFLPMIVESSSFRRTFLHGQGGSARWGGPLTFLKYTWSMLPGNAPIYLGRTLRK